MRLAIRLLPNIDPEIEWHFLLHDMLVGERCGAESLEAMAGTASDSGPLERMLLRQMEDERAHTRLYGALLGESNHRVPRYEHELSAYLANLPSLTLRVFALQALVEGISLGALEYRKRAVCEAPSALVDQRVHHDELRHVRFAYGYMPDLIARDGVVGREVFERVSTQMFSIFEASFEAERVGAFLREAYGVADLADVRSPGRGLLWRLTQRSVLKNRTAFLRRYEEAAKVVPPLAGDAP